MYEIKIGNVLEKLKEIDDEVVDTVVTSPPYYGLRDYGHDAQIGLEETPEEFINRLVEVFREVRRVLKPSGTLWVNIGDSYAGSGKGPSSSLNKDHHHLEHVHSKIVPDQCKPKDLIGIPWMLAFALRADGWYLRQDIIWSKPNPMPESVKDRCTKSHEYIFLLTKSNKYYYDHEAIKEEAHTTDTSNRDRDNTKLNNTPGRTKMGGLKTNHYTTKNKRSVWNSEDSKYGSIENEAKHRQGMHRERGENLVAHRPLLPKQKEFVDFIRQTPKSKLIEKSNIKASTIEHWYRYDDSGFSYPSVEDWNTISPLLEGNDVAEIDRLMTYIEWEYDDIKTSDTKNKRSVWNVSCKPFKGAHFAVFPPELIEPCILAGTSEHGYCSKCGEAYVRKIEKVDLGVVTPEMKRAGANSQGKYEGKDLKDYASATMSQQTPKTIKQRTLESMSKASITTGWEVDCQCDADVVTAVVLDPFAGSGTTGGVAEKHGRNSILIELNPEFASLIPQRIIDIQATDSNLKVKPIKRTAEPKSYW